MRLNIDSEHDAKLARLLDKVSSRLQADSSLLHQLHDGTLEMSCPLPPGYKPSMNQWAQTLRARLDSHWRLFEISEQSPGISGGWMASCIPPPMYRTFLQAWLEQAWPTVEPSPLPLGQLELFA